MSGEPQFDDAAVIDAAMRVFWRHGHAAASISHLTETGLSPAPVSTKDLVTRTASSGRRLQRTRSEWYEMLVALLRDGIANGELPNNTRVDALAWLYLGVLHSLLKLPQAGASADALYRMIDIAMAAWPPSSHAQPASTIEIY
ncbi:AcrR family transcriptional regulator [Paraburkholderia youngii]